MFTTRQGLSIVYLSGIEEIKNKRIKSDSEPIEFNLSDVENLQNNFEKRQVNSNECVDILLTNQWPKYIEKESGQQLDNNLNSIKFGSELISYLATSLKPRYHFSAMQNIFFERFPYRNHQILAEKSVNLSRFLALAKANKSNKPKYLYAFNITPAKHMTSQELAQQTASKITESPYLNNLLIKTSELKRKNAEEDAVLGSQFFYMVNIVKKLTA